MAGGASRFAFKLVSTVIAIPVGRLIAKGSQQAWSKARPHDPPHNPKEVQTSWPDALIFAGIAGFGTALGQLLTTKFADTAWRALTGTPSPRPKEPKNKTKKDRETADV